jgi:Leucine-rich repeat (LRR) protein
VHPFALIFCLAKNELLGTLPTGIRLLTKLETLRLYDNDIEFFKPSVSDITRLVDLRILDLSGNTLDGSIPTSLFENLKNLTSLHLEYMGITGSISSNIDNLSSLELLSLEGNLLNDTIPSEIFLLKNLRQLIFYDNELSGTLSSAVGSLLNLTKLSLRRNCFDGTVPHTISELKELKDLDLCFNKFDLGFENITDSSQNMTSICDLDWGFQETGSGQYNQPNIQADWDVRDCTCCSECF